MKFAIVLLGLVVLTAAVPQQRGVIDTVDTIVNSFIAQIRSQLEELERLVDGFTSNAASKVDGIIGAAKDQISASFAQLEQSINAMMAKGGAVALCAQKNLGDINEFKNAVGKNVDTCATNMNQAVSALEAELLAAADSLQGSILQLNQIANECTAKLFDAVVCAASKVSDVKVIVDGIVATTTQAVNSAQSQATVAAAQAQTCALQTVGEATIQINKFLTEVKACA